MDSLTSKIQGTPATFATRREASWKSALAEQLPRPSMEGREAGLTLRFVLPTLAPLGKPLDVDNLVEPVLSILIGQTGWFGGSRTRVRWWSATKEVGRPAGCTLTISSELAPPLPTSAPVYDGLYTGVFPRSATSEGVATWAAGVASRRRHQLPSSCTLYLGFGSRSVNVGAISTGVVKSFIDCLYPILGGKVGAPQDYRVSQIIVEKAVHGLAPDSVRVLVWYRDVAQDVVGVRARIHDKMVSMEVEAISNPCRPGTAKWIVCDGALRKRKVDEVKADLEKFKPGSGRRLKEYMNDLRSENNLDVRIEDGVLVHNGPLRK